MADEILPIERLTTLRDAYLMTHCGSWNFDDALAGQRVRCNDIAECEDANGIC